MTYTPAADRYSRMIYNRCGASGLKLPAISLGLWHNFGHDTPHATKQAICRTAFDLGITHFDLANNYGPPPGSAEEAFGELLRTDFRSLRDELIISSKAGYEMWDGPYGEWGSRKYVIASCDQSLKRMGLDYVDIFYSHRFDPDTPLEETMGALDHIVRSGRAQYIGISSYNSQRTREAVAILKDLGTPLLIHQPSYNILNRWVETDGLKDTLKDLGIGSIAFVPLAQGILTMDYIEVARMRGEGLFWLIRREVLPNATAPLIAEFGLRFCFVLLFISALSFLGLGLQPPTADWGSMVRESAKLIAFANFSTWQTATFGLAPLLPAGAIAVLTVAVNLVVDWLLHLSSGLKD